MGQKMSLFRQLRGDLNSAAVCARVVACASLLALLTARIAPPEIPHPQSVRLVVKHVHFGHRLAFENQGLEWGAPATTFVLLASASEVCRVICGMTGLRVQRVQNIHSDRSPPLN